MYRSIFLVCFVFAVTLTGCKKEKVTAPNPDNLSDYLEINKELLLDDLIACAGGNNTEFLGDTQNPVSVFFYPEEGAYEFMYFETNHLQLDNSNLRNYSRKAFSVTELFNGTMMKFEHPAVEIEKWGIVTYKTEGKLHVCNPIRLKPGSAPTQDISSITIVTESGITPSFDWMAENEPENVIYFSIVSDTLDNLISGVYTYDKFWTFYDLSNVVLNVSPSNPSLTPGNPYMYTMMGVSEDNWVHTLAMQMFTATP